jgi:hypothetical protein
VGVGESWWELVGVGGSWWELVGVGGLPIMDELEPLEKTGPFQHFQMAFITIPVNP